jgi:hypothetical protein
MLAMIVERLVDQNVMAEQVFIDVPHQIDQGIQ